MGLSVLLIPELQVGFSVMNHIFGPKKTIEISHRMAGAILQYLSKRSHSKLSEFELKCLRKCRFRPWIACLETACSLEQLLAFRGQRCVIRIGKHVEDGRIQMHAWVETEKASYFKDERYAQCFEETIGTSENCCYITNV